LPPALGWRTQNHTGGNLLRFDCYQVDLGAGQLLKRGTRIRLREQSFQLLAALLEHPGQVVTRERLRHLLWRDDVFVNFDNNLNAVVAHLREVLSDSADHPRFIETLPKRGYRFIADVHTPPATTAEPKLSRVRLVVLPFTSLSGDPAQEYIGDAFTDEIITALVSLAPEHLAVIARTTAIHYKGSRKDVARISRELGVDYAVEGTIRQSAEQAVVNVQLIQSSDQAHLFAKRYEAELRDIFHMHSSIAQDIAMHIDAPGVAEAVRGRLNWAHTRRTPTENLAAYNDYIQGRHMRLTPEAMAGAKRHFEDAIARDPEFAAAHMALADLYTWLGYTGSMRPKDAYAIGVTHALRAVEIDAALAEAHAVLAEYHKQLDYNWPAAEREMARALELDSASPFVRFCRALVILMPHNRMDEAVAELERALELDPLAGGTRYWLGIMRLLARDHDGAIDEARGLLELEPTSWWPPFLNGLAYRQKCFEESSRGRPRSDLAEKAIAEHRRAVELAPGAEHLRAWLGFALGVCGRKEEARGVLEEFHRSDRYILPTIFAHMHLGLGGIDTALEWFDRAVEERDQNMMPILRYAPRSHPGGPALRGAAAQDEAGVTRTSPRGPARAPRARRARTRTPPSPSRERCSERSRGGAL
jgi:TolB-like protein/tetratricopeptide (TPR) repeat protein